MSSAVADPQLAAALDALHAAIDRVQQVGVAPVDGRDAYVVVRELQAVGNRMAWVQAQVLTEIDLGKLHREDAHASAKVMVRHAARLSPQEAARRARLAKALRDLPAVSEALRSGTVGSCQAERIARTHANPRVRHRLARHDAELVRLAQERSYPLFDALLADWERRADADGAAQRNQRNHEHRTATLHQDFDGSWTLAGGCGSLDGAELRTILDAFTQAEWEADWARARSIHGPNATTEDLARTDAQRRWDALMAIARKAASVRATETGTSIETVLVMTIAEFEDRLARHTGAAPTRDRDPDLDDRYRCSTIDGHPIDPDEATAAALIGHVSRVVIGADSVVIDKGRRQRLFTGHAHLAAQLTSHHCTWTGCLVPTSACQIDHMLPWNHDGPTDQDNATPNCSRHNRHKQNHGFDAIRHPDGTIDIIRPDGTTIPH